MQARMKSPVFVLPDAMKALYALNRAIEIDEVPLTTHKLVHLRASQINGYGPCVAMHSEELKHAGETDQRIFSVGAWRETPYYTDAERAALALTESLTRLSDRADAVPDDVWDEATRHYDEKALAALILSIGQINIWNRVNCAVRQIAGSWKKAA
ncbi:MAG: carboxymuconolactone decarboxylase family protein [Xanthobacteraceae bacterium]|nr:carboxymuconolactone decarboxylase family protein [Xanthobacteraceae bacterium]